MISGHSRRAGFRADPHKSPCFIGFSPDLGTFFDPIFRSIFPTHFQSGSHHGIYGSVVCEEVIGTGPCLGTFVSFGAPGACFRVSRGRAIPGLMLWSPLF
jgi:hypothetical protein